MTNMIVRIRSEPNVQDCGWTPLHLAAKSRHLKACEILLNFVEDKNPEDDLGYRPLTLPSDFKVFELIKCHKNKIE